MRLITLLIILLFPLIILSFNFLYLVGSKNVYLAIFEEVGVYENFQSKNEVDYLTDNLTGFYRGKNMLDPNFYSNQARLHLTDVKNLINLVKIFNLLSTLSAIITLSILALNKKFSLLTKSLSIGSLATIIIVLLLFMSFAFNFTFAFEKMHLVLFRNNLWLFDASDSLIKLFPQSFFVNFAIILVANITITAFSLFALSRVFKDYD